MKTNKGVIIGAFALLLGATCCIQAQLLTAETDELQPIPHEALPRGGTFWLAKGPNGHPMPPFPALPPGCSDLPVYSLGNGQYLVDDSEVNYFSQSRSQSISIGVPMPGDGTDDSTPLSPDSGDATNTCPCCMYPTNATLKWFLTLPIKYGPSRLSLSPDGMLYVGTRSLYYNQTMLGIDSGSVDTNDPAYPNSGAFAYWPDGGNDANYGCLTIGPDETVYASSWNWFRAFDSTLQTNKWALQTDSYLISGDPVIANDGTIYVATQLYLYAITNAIGMTDMLTVTNRDASLNLHSFNYSLENIGIKWIMSYPDAYVANTNLATFPSPGPFQYAHPIVGNDGTIYINSSGYKFVQNNYFPQSQVLALNPTNGAIKWVTRPLDFRQTMMALGSDETIYFGAGSSFYAIAPSAATNGMMSYKWVYTDNSKDFSVGPIVGGDGTIYVESVGATNALYDDGTIAHKAPSGTNALFAFNPNGNPKWVTDLGYLSVEYNFYYNLFENFSSRYQHGSLALASDGELYLADDNGMFYSFCSATGKTNYSYQTYDGQGNPQAGLLSPIIGKDGTIYFVALGFPYFESPFNYPCIYAFAGPAPIACSSWPEDRKNARRTASVETAQLSAPFYTSNAFYFAVTGNSNVPTCICATTDLKSPQWTNIGQINLTGGITNFVDSGAGEHRSRFYIAKPQ